MEPDVKLLMRLKKDQLIYKLKKYSSSPIDYKNTPKQTIAEIIASIERDKASAAWSAISNG